MNKRNITKLEKLVEKLKNATPRSAYNAVCKLSDEDIFSNILHNLVKDDFTIDPGIARSIIYEDLSSDIFLENIMESETVFPIPSSLNVHLRCTRMVTLE